MNRGFIETDQKLKLLGYLLALVGALCFALMSFFVRLSEEAYSNSDILFARSMVGVIIMGILVRDKIKQALTSYGIPIWLRSAFGAISVSCFYWNILHSSLTIANLLTDLSPIFVLLLSALIFRTRLTILSVIGVFIATGGVFLLSSSNISGMQPSVVFVGLISAAASAVAYLSIKSAVQKFSTLVIVWAFSVGTAIVSVINLNQVPRFTFDTHLAHLGASIVLAFAAQFFMTFSYKFLAAHIASTLNLTSCFWAVVLDSFIGIYPNQHQMTALLLTIVGIITCIIGNR